MSWELIDRVQGRIGTKKPQVMRFSQGLGTSGLAGAEGLGLGCRLGRFAAERHWRSLTPRHALRRAQPCLVAESLCALTKNREASIVLASLFLAGAEGLGLRSAPVSSRQSATGARSPLDTRFWSGCGGTQQAVGEGQGCAVLTEKSRKVGADLVLREVFLLFSKKNNKSLSSLNFNNEQPS